jgi:hypothetical protein
MDVRILKECFYKIKALMEKLELDGKLKQDLIGKGVLYMIK